MPLAEGAGRQPFVVVANGPNLTAEGRRLRDLGWVEPNLAMDLFQRPEVRGRSEYLRLRSGAQVLGPGPKCRLGRVLLARGVDNG